MPTDRLIDDLPTPALLIDAGRLERNIARMQAMADAQGVRLRPHVKTHRSVAIARMQREAGAHGLTVAKPAEAEAFVDAGFDDVRIAYVVVGEEKWERIARLSERARVSFLIDTIEAAQGASKVFQRLGKRIDVLLEVDTGHGRCGVDPGRPASVELARTVADLPGLRLAGILTHGGYGYFGPVDGETPHEALVRSSRQERDRLLDFAVLLREAGLVTPDFELSVGSTPTMSVFENRTVDGLTITEIRPGNYVFHDAIQVSLGSCTWEDCAMSVLTTVTSRHRESDGSERVFIDAGKKALSADKGYATDGYGAILYNAANMTILPHARITALSEEHGWVTIPGGSTLDVGARIRVVPNHACLVASLFERMYLVSGDHVVGEAMVDARGKSQ